MLPLGSVKVPKRLLAWFAESLEGTGLGYRKLPIKSYPYSASRWPEATPSTEKKSNTRMKRKHQRILELIFSRPVSGTLTWRNIEALFHELGIDVLGGRTAESRSFCLVKSGSSTGLIECPS